MFKKTRVRQIIELLQKNLSDREISGVLGVSRNSVARIRQSSDEHCKEWDELLIMSDDELNYIISFILISSSPKAAMRQLTMRMSIVSSVKSGLPEYFFGKNTVKNVRMEAKKLVLIPRLPEATKDILSAGIIPAMWSINQALHLRLTGRVRQ